MNSLPNSTSPEKKSGRGGRRPGAGRKPKPKLTAEQIVDFLKSPQSVEKLLDLRLRKFKLSKSQFEELLARQKGLCGLCERPLTSPWTIDHDHLTGKVRALLHSNCNPLLGAGGDDPQRFAQAIDYLKRHNKFLR